MLPNAFPDCSLAQSVDSYVGEIAIDSTGLIGFDLGWYSNTLTKDLPQIIERLYLQHLGHSVDTSELIIVDSRRGIAPIISKTNISWDTFDGYTAKIASPIKSGIGITGVYIDSLWQARSDKDYFNLSTKNYYSALIST